MNLVLITTVVTLMALGALGYILWAAEDTQDDPFGDALEASMLIEAAGWEAAQAIYFSEQYEGRER